MASCAAAVGLGIDYNTIRQGLMSFYSNQNPGRFNMYFVNNKTFLPDIDKSIY